MISMYRRTKQSSYLRIIDVLGWLGAIAIVFAYFALITKVWAEDSLAYDLLNLFGAIGLLIEAGYKKDYQPVFLNFVWAAIALYSLF